MPKEWSEQIQKENYKDLRDNHKYRGQWERDAVRFEDFRYGSHFSRSEEQEMLLYRQAPLPISITTAICDTAESLMVSNPFSVHVAPIIHPYNQQITDRSKKVSSIYDYLVKKSWYDSLGGLQYDRVVRDYTNVGHGLFYVVPRNEYGEFNVDIKHLNWRYFYPHPLTKSPFYDDADNHIIHMELSKSAAFKFVKAIEPDMTMEQFVDTYVKDSPKALNVLPQRYMPGTRKEETVMFIQKLVLEEQFVYYAIPLKETLNYDRTEIGYKVYTEYSDYLKQQEAAGSIRVEKERRVSLTEYTSIGRLGYKVVYPIDCYNIVPLVYDHRDTPYPIGRVWYLYPLQRALNKFIMISILNGSLMNSMRVIYEEDSVNNINEWKYNFATPGAMLSWKQVVPGYTKPPVVIEGKPLNEAWLAMPRYLTYLMEYISGIFGVMMGDSRESPDIFSTVAALQSAGGSKIKRRLAQADASVSKVGYVVGKFYKEYAPPNGFATFVDEKGEMQDPQTYNVLRPTKNEDGSTGIEIDPDTDLSIGFKDIRFTTQSSQGFESGTEAALMTTLATQLKVPELLPEILKRVNIPDVDKIIGKIDRVNQQASSMEEMSAMIKELDNKTKIMANQIEQKGYETKWAKFEAELDKLKNKIKPE